MLSGRGEVEGWASFGTQFPFINSRREWPDSLLKIYQNGKLSWGSDNPKLSTHQEKKLLGRYKTQFHQHAHPFVGLRGPLREWDVEMESEEKEEEGKSNIDQILIDGERGTGKSSSLLHLVLYGRQSGYLVLYFPDSFEFAQKTAQMTPCEEYEGSFNAHLSSQPILECFYQAHYDQLKNLPIQRQETLDHLLTYKSVFNRKAENFERDFKKAMPDDKNPISKFNNGRVAKHKSESLETLADLVSLGASDTSCSSVVLTDLIYELRELKDLPVIVAIDGVNYLNHSTAAFRAPTINVDKLEDYLTLETTSYNQQNIHPGKMTRNFTRPMAPYEINVVAALMCGVANKPGWNEKNKFKNGVVIGATEKKHPMAKDIAPYRKEDVPLIVELNNFTQFEFFSWVHRFK